MINTSKIQIQRFKNWSLAISSGFFFLSESLEGSSALWINNASSANWNVNANWNPASFPNAIDDTATFDNGNGSNFPRTVTLGQNLTVGTLSFASTLGSNYTISGANSLTFQVSSGSSFIQATSGPDQTITCPLILNSPLIVNPVGSGLFTISGDISGPGKLTKQDIRTLVLSGNNTYLSTEIKGGMLSVANDANLGLSTGGIAFTGSSVLGTTTSFSTNRDITLSSGVTGLLFPAFGSTLTLNGTISGNGNFALTGGTLIPTNTANSFTGQFIFNNGGILQISDPAQLGNATLFNFRGGSFSTVHTTQTMTINLPMLISTGNGGVHVQADVGTTATYTGNLSNNAISPATFEVRDGDGTVALRGDNSGYSNGMFVTGNPIPFLTPTLNVAQDKNFGNPSSFVRVQGGSIEFAGNVISPPTRTFNLSQIAVGLMVQQPTFIALPGTSSEIQGVIQRIIPGSSLPTIIVQGAGTLAFTNPSNTFAWGVQINNSGTLQVLSNGSLGVDIATNTIQLDDGSLEFLGSIHSVNRILLLDGTSPGTLILDDNTASIWDGQIQGNRNLTLAKPTLAVGTGKLALTANNSGSYTGNISINDVTLQISNSNQLGSGTNLTLNQGTLEFLSSVTIPNSLPITLITNGTFLTDSGISVLNSVVSGTGTLIKDGNATLLLGNASNTYFGGTEIDSGTLQITTDGNLGDVSGGVVFAGSGGTLEFLNDIALPSTRAFTYTSNGTIQVDGGTSTISGSSLGAGSLTKTGPGNLILFGVNNYTGGTAINTGTLTLSGTGQLSAVGSVNVLGTFDIAPSSISQTIGDLSGSGLVNLGTNTLTAGSSTSSTFSGVIQGTGGFNKAGSGTLTLTGNNTYSGGTSINAGTLALSGTGTLLSTGAVNVDGIFDISASSGSQTIGDLTGSGVVTLGSKTLIAGTSNSTTFGGAIQGTGGFTKEGSGTLSFTGNSTYTGVTLINNGTLALSGTGSLSPNGSVNVLSIFDISASTIPQAIGDLLGSGLVNLGATNLTAGTSNSTTFNGVIQGTGGFSKAGSGTLTLTGNNTYSGGTVISAGKLALSGTGTLLSTGSVNVIGTFDISGSTIPQTIGDLLGSGIVTLGANTLTAGTSNSTLFSGSIQGTGGFNKTGTGTLTLTGNNTYSGGTVINLGTLALSGAGKLLSTGSVDVNGIFDISGSVNSQTIGDLTGTGLVNLGSKTLIAGSSNSTTFSGVIQGTGGFTKEGSGTLTFTGNNTYTGGTLINTGTLALSGTGSLSPTGAVDVRGIFDISPSTGNQTIGDLLGSGLVNLGANTLTAGTSNSTTFSGVIQGTGGFNKAGSGILTLRGTNTYSGGTQITDGTLQIIADANLGNPAGGVTFAGSGGTLELLNGLTLSSSRVITLSAPGTLKTDTGISSFNGTFTGADNLTKQGAGTLYLGGVSSNTGNVTIAQGSLIFNGNMASSGLTTVNAGTFLGGTGTLNNVLIFGILSPGNPLGAMHGNQFTFQNGSKLQIEIMDVTADQIIATDFISILSGTTLEIIPQNLVLNNYTIATAAGGVTGAFSSIINEFPRYSFTVLYEPNSIILNVGTNSFVDFFDPGNLKNIADCFDSMIDSSLADAVETVIRDLSTSPDIIHIVNVLNSLSVPEIIAAFNQFDPSLYGSINIAELDTSQGLLEFYTNHMSHYRLSAQASCARGLKNEESCGFDQATRNFWIAPFALKDQRDKTGSIRAYSGYQNRTYGIASGIDFQCIKDLFATIGLSYSNSQIKWRTAPQADAMYNSFSAIGGASYVNSCLSLEACFTGTYHAAKAERKIYVEASPLLPMPVAPIDYKLQNYNQAYSLASSVSAALNIYTCRSELLFTIWPYLNADYLFVHQYEYSEKGGDSLDMHMHTRETDLFVPEWGLGFSIVKDECSFLFYSDASIGYSHEFRFQGRQMLANFREAPNCLIPLTGLFSKKGMLIPRFDVGLQNPCNGLAFFFSYKGALCSSFKGNQFSMELRMAF